jgi:holliday junction DNA helicase RuvA
VIAHLRGTVLVREPAGVVLEVGGVGYRVAVPIRNLDTFKEGSEAAVWTYHHLREDSSQLFGFTDRSDRRLFERLLSVSGVGPKVALSLLSLRGAAELEGVINAGGVAELTALPGVGKKTAERIVLELGGKLSVDEVPGSPGELESALVELGYKAADARKALEGLDPELPESDRLREALKRLAR